MKYDNLEKVLADTPVPRVIEGDRRARLKSDLVRQIRKEGSIMPRWKKRIAWAACALLVVSAVVFACNEVRKRFFVVHEEVLEERKTTLPDGSEMHSRVVRGVSIGSDDPDYTEEKAKQQYKEIQNLIAEGKGELLKVIESDSGEKCYVYKFILSDGEEVAWGTRRPLGDEHKGSYLDEIDDLIAQGKGELIEVNELDSGKKIYLYRFILSDGTSLISGFDTPLKLSKEQEDSGEEE